MLFIVLFLSFLAALASSQQASEAQIVLKGRVVDPQGNALPGSSVELSARDASRTSKPLAKAASGPDGQFVFTVPYTNQIDVKVEGRGFRAVTKTISVAPGENGKSATVLLEIRMTNPVSPVENVNVTADVNELDVLNPDPALRVFVTQDLLDANPGRPGAPVSIPGYPIETASSGIKAPQYFAPGVAGDHGEPIAQYIAVGGYLVPNNLSANAHGNGYADPNIFIPQILESVQVDGGAFNVREGNHSVNLAATYALRSHLDPFLTITGDYRDIDMVGGFSPNPVSFLSFEASYGNGFLDRLEHRQQYKLNGQRIFHMGEHRLTLFGIGYYGQSYVPGLVPIFAPNSTSGPIPNYGDTIDPRQKDQTHTALAALNDQWQLSHHQQFQFSGFFRTYNLALYSNFGQGLIRQSEFRTVAGASASYLNKVAEEFSVLAGLDSEREAPRRDNLDQYGPFNANDPGYYGPFAAKTSNNVTIGSLTPYIAAQGVLAQHLRYYLGWRRDEIDFNNDDLLLPQHSFQAWVGVNSPKATLTFLPRELRFLPLVSLSFGQSFFTNDPRIGSGSAPGTPVSTAHSYQLVTSKTVRRTDFKLTLGHVTTSQTLAKLDPDTGLQEPEGPGRLRFVTMAVRENFRQASLLATFSKADARDLMTGLPTPEAPRTIFDLLGAMQKLPWQLQLRGEFEYVGTKPLGAGCTPDPSAECTGVPVKEFRAAVVRPFLNGRVDAGVNMLIAGGDTGQTTENFDSQIIQQVVGVHIPSYAGVNFTYHFGRSSVP